MKPGFFSYVRSAFSARPAGMFISPNWIGVGAFGLLGFLNPGFWVIGLGLELAYLGLLASDNRFQLLVRAQLQRQIQRRWQVKIDESVGQLSTERQRRYRTLENRCRAILEQQLRLAALPSGLEAQDEGLGRLLWVYLRLLMTEQAIEKMVRESSEGELEPSRLEGRIAELRARLTEEGLGEELRKSLKGQSEILEQRLQKRGEAREKLAFLEAELTRIQEQVEFLREQAVLSTDPETVSQRIDQISATLGGTSQWISEQQKIYGAMEDMLAQPPPLAAGPPAKESQ
jgi:hypothetical protein